MFHKLHVNRGFRMRNPFKRNYYQPMNGKAERFANFLDEIIQANQDCPTIVVDIDDIVKKFKIWEEKMENIHPYYYVGCNRDPFIVKLISLLGRNFTCTTISEIHQIFNENNGSPILLTNPCKTNGIIHHAFKRNVELLVFDSEAELQKIKFYHPSASLLIRLRIGDPNSVNERKEQKYGVDLGEGKDLLRLAKSLNLDVVGVCFHVGTNCTDPNLFVLALRDSQIMFNMGINLGFDMWLLDIGGGFPGTSDILKSENTLFNQMSKVISRGLLSFFPKDGNSKVIAEPGRFFVESAIGLVVRIVGKRLVKFDDDECYHYHINESIYGLLKVYKEKQFRPLPEPILSRDEHKKRRICKTVIWGRSCNNQDWINKNIMFPLMDLGEYIMYTHCGAYLPMDSCNQWDDVDEKPRIKYFIGDKTRKYLKKYPQFDEKLDESSP